MLKVVKSGNTSTAKSTAKKTTKSTDKSKEKAVQHEIEMHVRKIRTLIEKLPPKDRQDYFSGLLNHILSDNVSPETKAKKSKDINGLSRTELVLLTELSQKMEELYRTMDYNPYL